MTTVSRRCVFYVSGFDPKGAGYYHALYRDEGARQSSQDGWQLDVGARGRQPSGNPAWPVKADFSGQQVQTHYEFMRWDDVVRRHWPKTTWALWRDVVTATVFYLRHGAWWKMFRLSWPPAVAVFAPFLLVCAMLAGIPLVAASTAYLVGKNLGYGALGLVAGGLAGALLWALGRKLESRYSMYWMMRSYAFTAMQARGELPDLETRLDELARCLVERIQTQHDDEVMVVGHSSGAIMAAIVVARALQSSPHLLSGAPKVSLLTLGQWIPLLGLLPMAQRFRQELQTISEAEGLTWIDFSAPPDGCCFALTDPLKACGVAIPQPPGVDLKLLNPRFASLFDAATYAKLKRNKFLMHFQYLHAVKMQGGFNYFEMTAGPLSLKARFAAAASVNDYAGLRPFGTESKKPL